MAREMTNPISPPMAATSLMLGPEITGVGPDVGMITVCVTVTVGSGDGLGADNSMCGT
ncbi:hypothetical protein GCM10023193_23670 [Planotetraspora kaengkrachanensis]